jgi:hypothetical protein
MDAGLSVPRGISIVTRNPAGLIVPPPSTFIHAEASFGVLDPQGIKQQPKVELEYRRVPSPRIVTGEDTRPTIKLL